MKRQKWEVVKKGRKVRVLMILTSYVIRIFVRDEAVVIEILGLTPETIHDTNEYRPSCRKTEKLVLREQFASEGNVHWQLWREGSKGSEGTASTKLQVLEKAGTATSNLSIASRS